MAAEAHAATANAQLAAARRAESNGALGLALELLGDACRQLRARGQASLYVLEWKAQLETAVGDHACAESSLLACKQLAVVAGHRPAVFRMDLLRAHNAIREGDQARAEELLAALRGDGATLGSPAPRRYAEISRWLRELAFRDRWRQVIAALRVEAALVIAELWAAHGHYDSAHRLVASVHAELPAASSTIDSGQVTLRQTEWLVAAGRLEEAEASLARVLPSPDTMTRIRVGLVTAHLALARGHLADALRACSTLDPPPGTPSLFTAVVAAKIAVLVELNLLQQAQQTASAAIARLGGARMHRPFVELLERASASAAARRSSAIAQWELPFRGPPSLQGDGGSEQDRPTWNPALAQPSAQGPGFAATWIRAANRVMLALERGDLLEAARQQADLEQITKDVESHSVTAQVALSAALVSYYRRGPTIELVDELDAIATAFERTGCRLGAARAARFAAWASAALGHRQAHFEHSQRAASLLETVSRELGVADRMQFLMNKWNGRDELAAALMRRLLEGGSATTWRPSRSELCRTYRKIDALTHWPIDDALGDPRARTLADPTRDVVARWVDDQLASRTGRRGAFRLRSVLGLWRIPRQTLILHYHMLADRTYLFRIAFGHIDLRVLPAGRLHLTRDLLGPFSSRRALSELATYCGITEALDDFRSVRRLVIIPHDAIANVPFAALLVDGNPLCARVTISQLDRLSRLRRPRRRRRNGGRFVSVGRRAYAGSGYADLPSAEVEAAIVGQLAPGAVKLLLGDDATIGNVLGSLTGARGVHVAAHGVFDAQHPDQAGILLRDQATLRTLSIRELQKADLRSLDLVTLATCRSAAHATLPGRERICLPTALLDAGARGVIASLWPIEDRASTTVMAALYRHLRSAPPSIALAQTQAALSSLPATHWGGLVFYGND